MQSDPPTNSLARLALIRKAQKAKQQVITSTFDKWQWKFKDEHLTLTTAFAGCDVVLDLGYAGGSGGKQP